VEGGAGSEDLKHYQDTVLLTATPVGSWRRQSRACRHGRGTTAKPAECRLLDPDRGMIQLDGHELRSLRLEDVRRHIAMVDQLPCALRASIADNLRYVRSEASDDELAAVVQAVGLGGLIQRLPDGYDTVVGERGLALSAGERQRLAIARALLANLRRPRARRAHGCPRSDPGHPALKRPGLLLVFHCPEHL
jgi:hypothetical protein